MDESGEVFEGVTFFAFGKGADAAEDQGLVADALAHELAFQEHAHSGRRRCGRRRRCAVVPAHEEGVE